MIFFRKTVDSATLRSIGLWLPNKEDGAPCMNNFGVILRNVVFFLFPVPFLLSFAIEHGKEWTAWVAYIAVVALVLAAVASGWVASRTDR